jgi:hypothetical protein
MNRRIRGVLFYAAALQLVSCAPAATDEELNQMCARLVELRGEIDATPLAERVGEVEKEFVREEKRLKDWMARDLKSWDDELATKLGELEDEEEKKKLTEEYAKQKEITRGKHQPGIDALEPKKKEAIEAIKKKVAASEQEVAAAVAECVGQAKKEGVSQKLAQCRIKAADKDAYWNKCR